MLKLLQSYVIAFPIHFIVTSINKISELWNVINQGHAVWQDKCKTWCDLLTWKSDIWDHWLNACSVFNMQTCLKSNICVLMFFWCHVMVLRSSLISNKGCQLQQHQYSTTQIRSSPVQSGSTEAYSIVFSSPSDSSSEAGFKSLAFIWQKNQ